MKTNKIVIDLLKQIYKNKDVMRIMYGFEGDYIYLSPDGYVGYKIPNKDFFIDMKKAVPDRVPIENIVKKYLNDKNHEDAFLTNDIKKVDKVKCTAIKISNDKTCVWVNEKFLKEFDKDCTFKILSPKSPIFIYENEEMAGFVMPIKID